MHKGDLAEVKQACVVGCRHLCNEAVAPHRPEINGALGIAVFIGERANEVAVVFAYINIGSNPFAEKQLRFGQRVNTNEQVGGVVGIERLA